MVPIFTSTSNMLKKRDYNCEFGKNEETSSFPRQTRWNWKKSKQLVVVPSQPLSNKSTKNKCSKPSRYIILCCEVIDGNLTTNSYWYQEDLSILKRIKNSVVGNKNAPHFEAKGILTQSTKLMKNNLL